MAIRVLENQPIRIWDQSEVSFNNSTSDCKYHKDYFIKAECSDPYQLEFLTDVGVEALNEVDFAFTEITGTTTSGGANLIDATATFLSDSIVPTMQVITSKVVVSVLNDTTIDVDPDPINFSPGQGYQVSWWGQVNTSVTGGQMTMTPAAPLPIDFAIAFEFDVLTVGVYYVVTIDIDSSDHDIEVLIGDNSIIISNAGDVGEFSVTGICTGNTAFGMQVLGSSGTTVLNGISAVSQGSFLPVIVNCDNNEVVYGDHKGDQTTIDNGTVLFEIDFTLLGSGYTCPEGCYSVGVLELQSGQAVDNITGIPYNVIVSDTFTESSNTNLDLHTPEIGDGYFGPLTVVDVIQVDAADDVITAPTVLSQPDYRIDYSNKTDGNFLIQFSFRAIGAGATGNFFAIKWRLTSTVSSSTSYRLDINGDLGYTLRNLSNDVIGFSTNTLLSTDVITILHVGNVIKIYVNEDLDLEVTDVDTTNINNTFSVLLMGGGASGTKTTVTKLTIGQPLTGQEDGFILSDCMDVRESHDCTLAIQSTASSNIFGFNFVELAFKPFIRLEGEFRRPKYNTDRTNDIDSLGDSRTIYFQSNKLIEMYLYQLPEYIHDAVRLMIGQDSLFVGDGSFTAESQDYTPDWQLIGNKEYDLASVSVPVVKKTENNKNINC